ncbi:MAG: NADH-ubiquinone oxidoreductase-F iron-sulfur binding region domain-containing protein [Castellaniella sp.]
MTIRLYIPLDSAALATGAQAVVTAFEQAAAQRSLSLHIVRNGSWGLHWLEPMVEAVLPEGRIAFGPVTPADAAAILEAIVQENTAGHPLCHGPTQALPWIRQQERLCFARVGRIDPLDIADYEAHEGFAGLRRALEMAPADIVRCVTASGLRGRGGAAFPTGIKWQTALETDAPQKYIVCNADEGDSGTFSDRMLMEGDPFALIEGMIIAGLAIGATRGYIYIRSEYPQAENILEQAMQRLRDAGWLGEDIQGSGARFDIALRRGAGAYICGEETSLMESIEGRTGLVRAKPPLPAIQGLFGQPTVINNVITLASLPFILTHGDEAYRDYGMGRSRGTLPFQLAGNIRHGGLVEKAFGLTLRELLYDFGGGSASGRPLRAVQVGGPLGAWLPESQWDIPLDYEAFLNHSAMLGHGGVVAFDDTVDMAAMAEYAMAFCAIESCGKCTPCRIGSVRGAEIIRKIREEAGRSREAALLEDLCETMMAGSLCALGGMTPYPVLSALRHFPQDFGLPAHSGQAGA